MKFYTDNCPICHKPLDVAHVGTITWYSCLPKDRSVPAEYVYREIYNKSASLTVIIGGFCLLYSCTTDETDIKKMISPVESKRIITIGGPFPIDWDNLDRTIERLNNLVIFS